MERRIEIVGRRDVLVRGAAAAALLTLLAPAAIAQDKTDASALNAALKAIMGDAKPIDGRFTFELPEIAESGNTVPYGVTVESPMTDAEYVKSVHILASGNPQPGVASFYFTPLSGKAQVAARLRLARTQEVVAVAELSDGKFLLAKRTVKVTIGGCGG